MLKRIILATAAAGALAVAALPSTASAGQGPQFHNGYGGGYGQGGYGYFQFGGPGWSFGFGERPQFRPHPICRPVVKNVKWWDNYGYPHWSQVVVSQNCGYPRPHPQWGGWNGGDWRNHDFQNFGGGQGDAPGNPY